MNYSYNQNYYNPYARSFPPPNYGQGQFQQQPQQPVFQQPMQQQIQQSVQYDIPLREVKFVTSEEAKAYIVMPNSASLLIDKQQGMAYIKSADSMGQSFMESYSFKKYEQGQETGQNSTKQDTSIDLSGYVKKDELDGFVSLKEYKQLLGKVEQLQKQIIGGRTNGNGTSNGKQGN